MNCGTVSLRRTFRARAMLMLCCLNGYLTAPETDGDPDVTADAGQAFDNFSLGESGNILAHQIGDFLLRHSYKLACRFLSQPLLLDAFPERECESLLHLHARLFDLFWCFGFAPRRVREWRGLQTLASGTL